MVRSRSVLQAAYLDGFVLQTKTIERVYSLFGIFRPVIVDETITQTLTYKQRRNPINITNVDVRFIFEKYVNHELHHTQFAMTDMFNY